MRFGIYVPNFGDYGDARRLADLARLAEDSGWDGLFLWDHVARPQSIEVVDPWVALAAMAMNTTSLRIGALVTPLPRRRPWKVARESVSVDHLSGGRLVFGVGIGSGRKVEWDAFGEETDFATRGVMLDEGLEVLTGLWSGEPFTHHGTHYHVEAAHFAPPLQRPRVPIWVAGVWPNKPPFRRAARFDGVFPLGLHTPFLSPDEVREIVAYVRAHRTSTDPLDVVVGGTSDGPKATAAAAALRDAGATWWLEWAETEAGSLARLSARVGAGPPRLA